MKHWLILLLFLFTVFAYGHEIKEPRIISLTPSFTDIIVDLDATGQLVGASALDQQRFPILNQLDSIGDFGSYSIEKIVSLKPDIILMWPSAINTLQQQQLSSLGIEVISLDPQSLDDLMNDTLYLAKRIGKEDEGNKLVGRLQEQLIDLEKRYHREERVTVFYQIWDKPIYTIGKKQIINDAFRICGAKNIFDDIDLSAPQVDIETILVRNPQVIIASNSNFLDGWKQWSQLSAVKNNKLILFQDDRIARPSIDMIGAIEKLCQQLK